jgi:hypothetical protein
MIKGILRSKRLRSAAVLSRELPDEERYRLLLSAADL